MKKILLAILSVAFIAGAINAANPKWEFRGAWMHTINQGQYAKQTTAENMAYFECSDCGKKHKVFGESHIEEIAKEYNVDTVAQIPINNKLAAAVDAGAVELFDGDWLDNVADKLLGLL